MSFFCHPNNLKHTFMKNRSIILLLLMIPLLITANTLSKNQMVTLGTRAFHQKAQGVCPEATSFSLRSCDYLRDGEVIYMAVLHFDRGFLFLSAEDAVTPVLAYGFTYDIDMENLAPGVQDLLSQYRAEIAAARRLQLQASEQVRQAWEDLRNPSRATSTADVVVSPLITATWNQNKYYNYYSPRDENSPATYDGKVPNGCVAVAMAQIIYYYRFPESGSGSHTNYTYDYGSFHVDFGQQQYCYDAMADKVTFYNNEVAKLIFHCATSVDMSYGPDGSGASSHNVPGAMSTYFKYNTDSQFRRKHDYNNTEWKQMIKTDLDARRPVYYSGYSESGGHAFVCDGYNSDDFFHFNFGWGGSGNGYYATQAIDSNTNVVNGYGNGQGAVFNLHPRSNSNYPSYCNERVLTATNGTLEDGSGHLDYLNNSTCTYIITDPRQYTVTIDLKKLSTQENHDYLRFWNGHPSQDSLLAEFSGSISGGSYQFETDSLYITFETDDSVTDEGWHLSYHSLREGIGCNIYSTHEPSGVMVDNSGDNNYIDNMGCKWMIRIPNASFINFIFEEMDISPEDHLDFYDISVYPYEFLQSYTGNVSPGVVTYYTNKVQVSFTSDNYLNASGFRVLWTTSGTGVEDFCSDVSVYPNPASDRLHITMADPLDQVSVSLYDMVGQVVLAQSYDGVSRIDVPVEGLTNGVYILSINSGGRTVHQKIVIRH